MRIRITGSGLYGKQGKPIPVGTEMEVKEMPLGWKSRCQVISGGGKAKTAVTNPAVTNPAEGAVQQTYVAEHRGRGSYSVMMGEEEVVPGLDKETAERFNALTDAEKAEQVKAAQEAVD